MLKITVLCVGNLKEKYLKDAVCEYLKRLDKYCNVEVVEVEEHKLTKNNLYPSDISICLDKEADKIISKIPKNSYIISLCIEGSMYSSEGFCKLISEKMIDGAGSMCFIIGGSWGLSNKIKNLSDVKLSMSKMTFPHQLTRVILCEQLYRVFQILNCGKYHK